MNDNFSFQFCVVMFQFWYGVGKTFVFTYIIVLCVVSSLYDVKVQSKYFEESLQINFKK